MNLATCATCHQPIHWNSREGLWHHNLIADLLACPSIIVEPEPVEF